MNKFNKIVSSLGTALWPSFLELLKDQFVKLALKNLLGVAVKTAGFKVWLIKFLAENFFDELIVPTANVGLIEGKYILHVYEGKTIIKKMEGADNVQDYDDAVDDIMS